MTKPLKTYFFESSTICGIEAVDQGESLQFIAILLRKKKDELIIIKKETFASLEPLTAFIPKNTPTFLSYNTDQVLTKTSKIIENKDALVNKSFPSINITDFYYETIFTQQTAIVSVCRKELVDNLLKKISSNNILICGFSIGVSPIKHILSITPFENIQLFNKTLSVKHHEIQSISKQTPEASKLYNINGIEIENSYILAFCGALKYVLKSGPDQSNFEEQNRIFNTEVHQNHFFTVFQKTGLAILLIILLINFGIFSIYHSKVSALQETSMVSRTNKDHFSNLNTLVDKKQKTVEDILASSSSKSSFYIDRVVSKIPTSILLESISYQPLKKNIQENKEILVHEGQIDIIGETIDSEDFSEFIETLESFPWISNVSVQHYGTDSNKEAKFNLKITLRK